jgi:hypothetical protein
MNRVRFRALALAATALALPLIAGPAASRAQTKPTGVLPGYWEYQAKVAIIPVSKEYKCLKADEIENFLFNPCTRHYKCTYPVKEVGDGKVKLDGTWTDKKGREAKVKADGTYTPTQVKLKANVKTIHGLGVAGSITARRISDTCPPPGTEKKK